MKKVTGIISSIKLGVKNSILSIKLPDGSLQDIPGTTPDLLRLMNIHNDRIETHLDLIGKSIVLDFKGDKLNWHISLELIPDQRIKDDPNAPWNLRTDDSRD